jgi:hypothetical protein
VAAWSFEPPTFRTDGRLADMGDVLSELAQSPALYPMAFDVPRDALLFLRLSEQDYRASAFLDERASISDRREHWLPVLQVERAMATPTAARPLHFIFHMGHVGSTLLSRLLDEADGVLSLREPLPLRAIAEAHDMGVRGINSRLETLLRLWERGFDGTKRVVLKATSTTERLAPLLLAMRPQATAVLLNVSAKSYLTTMFASPNSPGDLNENGPERMHRLGEMGIGVPRPSTLGELAAMSWLAEHVTQMRLAKTFGDRVLSVDFDEMLAGLEDAMQRVLAHFKIARPAERAAAMANSPSLSRYSKAQDREYSPDLRASVMAEVQCRFAGEIREALQWLDSIVSANPQVTAL